eukprot:COSAG05_NODE_1645_length_4351_cov_17.986595_3_plen_130_part_00
MPEPRKGVGEAPRAHAVGCAVNGHAAVLRRPAGHPPRYDIRGTCPVECLLNYCSEITAGRMINASQLKLQCLLKILFRNNCRMYDKCQSTQRGTDTWSASLSVLKRDEYTFLAIAGAVVGINAQRRISG